MKEFYHIIDRDVWAQARAAGVYAPESLADEGFIHCSYASQVLLPADALFRGQRNLVLLQIDPSRLTSDLRCDSIGVEIDGIEREWVFPHIYGPLNVDAVTAVVDFPPREDGRFALPLEVAHQGRDNSQDRGR